MAEIKHPNYYVKLNFQFNDSLNFYCLDKVELKVDKQYIENIFKRK